MNKNLLSYALENNLFLSSMGTLLFSSGLLLWFRLFEDLLLDFYWKMPFSNKKEITYWHKD